MNNFLPANKGAELGGGELRTMVEKGHTDGGVGVGTLNT